MVSELQALHDLLSLRVAHYECIENMLVDRKLLCTHEFQNSGCTVNVSFLTVS